MIAKLLSRLLIPLAPRLPKRVIERDDGDPYLERYYLFGEAGGLKYFPEGNREPRGVQKLLTWLPCVYLHRFVRSDQDAELHNHPWAAKSLILRGGYLEERRVSEVRDDLTVEHFVERRAYLPGDVNVLHADTYHRVDLLEEDAWTVIKLGEKVQTWGFWNRQTGEFVHWREHLARRKAGA